MPSFNERSFNSTAMQVLQTLDYENKIPPPTAGPWAFQAFLDRWRSQTAIMYGAKAIVGALTPVSPELQVQNWGLPTELQNDINKAGSLNKGVSLFLAKHPDAQPFTVWQSGQPDRRSRFPTPSQPRSGSTPNMGIITLQPRCGPAPAPHRHERHLQPERLQRTDRPGHPPEVVPRRSRRRTANSRATSNSSTSTPATQVVLADWYPQYEKQIAGLTGAAEVPGRAELAADDQQLLSPEPDLGAVLGCGRDKRCRVRQAFAAHQQHEDPARVATGAPNTQVARETRVSCSKHTTPTRTRLVQGTADGFVGETQSEITQTWKDNLVATAKAHPELTNVITGLFMSLPNPGAVPAAAPGENAGAPGTFNAQSWRAA